MSQIAIAAGAVAVVSIILMMEQRMAWGVVLAVAIGWLVAATLARDIRDWRQKIRRRRGQCPRCGYDLRATPDQCPECGYRPGSDQLDSPG